jgi:DNA-binding NarL/FixJ family response regulator
MQECRPDVVVLDLPRGETSSDSLLEVIASSCAVVLLVDVPATSVLSERLQARAQNLLPRGVSGDQLVAAVEAVGAGLIVAHPDLERMLPSAQDGVLPISEFEGTLTPREAEILNMIGEGLGNKEIAWRLSISEHTVKFHVSSIFAKLHVSSRTEAVTSGIRRGLIII